MTRRYDRKLLAVRCNWKRKTPHLVSGVLADLLPHLAVRMAERQSRYEAGSFVVRMRKSFDTLRIYTFDLI